MGRRALRNVDPSLDLTGYLYTLDQLPRPCTAAALFGRALPLEVEVGSGKGLFLRSAAAAQPEAALLGIEIVVKYARFAAAQLAKRGLTNAKLIAGDAQRVFAEWLPAESLAAVHVYFPDPWWKKRHRKRRVMNETFLRHVEQALRPGGALHFWTDVEEYYHTSLAVIAAATRLQGTLAVAELAPTHDLDYRTHFERRMRQHQQAVYRAEFRKVGGDHPG